MKHSMFEAQKYVKTQKNEFNQNRSISSLLSNALFCLSYYNECKNFKVCFLRAFYCALNNSPEFNTESIRLKFLVFIIHRKSHDFHLKSLIHRH